MHRAPLHAHIPSSLQCSLGPAPMSEEIPPSETDEDAYIFIDHREEEAAIVLSVSQRLRHEHVLQVEENGDQMAVVFQTKAYPIPLQFSPHDRYIMISSLAELLKEHYAFLLLKPSLSGDTHGLLVTPHSSISAWGHLPEHLVPLNLGHDYFNGIRVPYLGHEDAAPDFSTDRERVSNANDAMGELVQALFAGKLNDEAAAKIAALAATNPALSEAAGGRSQAEIAKELQQAVDDSLQSPEGVASRRELDKSLANLRSLTVAPPKPWWKFW